MNKEIVQQIIDEVYPKIKSHYGTQRGYSITCPEVEVHNNIFARISNIEDMEGEDDPIAEHDPKENKIFFYYPVVKTKEDVMIAPRNVISFIPSRHILKKLNELMNEK